MTPRSTLPYRQVAVLLALLVAGVAAAADAQTDYARGTIDVGLVVSDLDRSVAFYEQALGMQRAYSFDTEGAQARRLGLTDGAPFHVVAFRLTEEQNAPVLKLVRVGTPSVDRPEFIDRQAGLSYLTVFVRALEPVLERLRAHDVPLLGEAPVRLRPNQYLALIQDPDGAFIELIGPLTE